jgi:hypothetical protein
LARIAENALKETMLMSNRRWGIILALGALLFLAAGAVPVFSSSAYETDARQFAGELQGSGAFKFAEDTEDQLRSGKFELAFARYLFLKSHIRGSSLYFALNAMVDQRLHFLKSQMGLEEIPTYAAPYKKLKRRVRSQAQSVKTTDSTGSDQQKAKASAPPVVTPTAAEVADQESEASQPSEAILPAAPPADQEKTQPQEETTSPAEETQADKPEATKPLPPPSAWEKLKRRLKFW